MIHGLQDLPAGVLAREAFPAASGDGVRVAVVDSGIDATLVDGVRVLPGMSFDSAGAERPGAADAHGHGTAVVSTIRGIAPHVGILPVKVFDRELRATADALVAAIDGAVAADVHLVNLSLGTTNRAHRLKLAEALVRAARAGVAVVAADVDEAGVVWLPGSLPLAVGVSTDRTVAADTAVVSVSQEGAVRRVRLRANSVAALAGVSFAVATATGLLARYLSSRAHG